MPQTRQTGKTSEKDGSPEDVQGANRSTGGWEKIEIKKVTEILRSIGWPDDILMIDMETYFCTDYEFGKGKNALSIVEYVTNPQFHFTGLGLQINDNEPRFIPGPHVPWAIEQLKKKFGKALHNCTLVAKNNKFDCLILAEKFNIYPPYTIDVEDLSRYYDSRMKHDLGNLCKLFKLPAKGDIKQFKGLYWSSVDVPSSDDKANVVGTVQRSQLTSLDKPNVMTPEQRRAMKEYCLGDIKGEKSLLEILLPMLDNPDIELDLARHTLNLYLKPVLNLDVEQAIQIATDMDIALSEDLRKVAWVLKYRTKAKPNIPKIMRAKKIFPQILQDILPEGEVVPMKMGKNEFIPATAKKDVAFQLLLAHKDEKVRLLCRAKAACSSWSLHQSKIKHMIIQSKCSNGLLRIPLNFHGCHTGRWSGGGGWNPLNLGGKRDRATGQLIHPLIAAVRGTLMAPDGYALPIVDSAQIEARLLAWVAHQDDLVKGFADGEDIYSEFASDLFQAKVWKPSEEEKKTPEGRTADIRRSFGKDAILGCGYGMGANTFFDRCRQNDTLRPLFDSGEYDWDFINRLIKTYRTKYTDICSFWTEIEKCFRWPTKYPKERTNYRISESALLRFYRVGTTTKMQLPSGRVMNYRFATVSPKDDNIKYLHGHLYRGAITENLIQAMCRDLLGYWLLQCEENGIKIVLHSYDELVGCVYKKYADTALQTMIDIMSQGPAWAEGLPLAAEGMISSRYCK